MNVNVQITLGESDRLLYTSDEVGRAVLKALDADETSDTCTVQVLSPIATVGAVTPPPIAEPKPE